MYKLQGAGVSPAWEQGSLAAFQAMGSADRTQLKSSLVILLVALSPRQT